MNFDKFKKDERRRRLERSLKLSILKRNGDSSNDNEVMNNTNAQNWSFSIFSESRKPEDKYVSSEDNKQKVTTTEKDQKYTSYEPRIVSSNVKKTPKQDNCFNSNVQKVMATEKDQKYTSYEPRIVSSNDKKTPKQNNCFNSNVQKVTTTEKDQKYTFYEPRIVSSNNKKTPKQNNCFNSNVQKVTTTEKDQKYTSYEPRIASSNDKKTPKQDNCFNSNIQKVMTTEKDQKYTSYEPRIVSSNDKKTPKQNNCFNSNVQKVTTTEKDPKYTSYEPRIASSSVKESPKQNNCFDENGVTPLDVYKYLGLSKRNSKNSPKESSFMRFYNWKVALNQDYKLIIKGQLESGEIACSKPIIRRLTARSIQSICLHVYHLEGNIVDNENRLPEYVRGKFYNGFPDDWENVYSLWQSFIFQNCRLSFRWPTKITDSDDDIKSEVTMQSVDMDENNCPNSSNNNDTDHTTKMETVNNVISPNFETYIPSLENIQFPNLTKKIHGSKICNKENQREHVNCENITQSICSQQKHTLRDVLQEDKINVIVNNLLHKDCSKEYIVKLLQMFNCIEDVLSYRVESKDANKVRGDNDDSGLYSSQLQNRETLRSSYVPVYQNISPIKKCVDHIDYNPVNVHVTSNTILQEQSRNGLQRTNKKDLEDFESQVYGTPKIVFEKVLENRRASLKQDKQRKRKAMMNSTSKDYIKLEKRIKTENRAIHHSNFNDIDIEHNIKYSMPDDRLKISGEAIKPNALEQQKDIKKSKKISCTQGLVPCKENLSKSYYDSSVRITEDEESQSDNMNSFRTSYREKKNSCENKYDYDISTMDDEVELPMINYKKPLDTAKPIKHSVKKLRVINYH